MLLTLVLLLTSAPYSWDAHPDKPGVMKLYDGASGSWVLLGEYEPATDLYRPWCGSVGRCVAIPNARPPVEAPATNFGVGPRERRDAPVYRINGVECGAAEAHAAAEGALGWIVAVGGSDQQRAAVLSQIPADVRAKYLECSYDANHWAMRPGFAAGNPVALYVLNHDGTERHHRADGLVTPDLIAALREPDPKYDPRQSPDLTRGRLGGSTTRVAVGALGGAAGLLGMFSLFRPRRKDE